MSIAIGLALGIFLLLWIWIIFEIKNAPEYDENEMPIKKPSKRRFHIDISEDDINRDLQQNNNE